jgi:predicted nucleic acid-binding Zn ribbon protein
MENDGGQLFEEESGFIYEKEDLITLRPGREHAWLDGMIERILQLFRCKLTMVSLTTVLSCGKILTINHRSSSAPKLVLNPEACTSLSNTCKGTKERADDTVIHYYDRTRISNCVTMLMTFLILILLVVPVWLLYKMSVGGKIATNAGSIGVVLAFTLIVAAVLSAFTKAKRHEILAASAG